MRCQVLVIAGSDDEPAIIFNRLQFIYPDPNAADANSHLLDVAEFLKHGIEEAERSIASQVDRLVLPTDGG